MKRLGAGLLALAVALTCAPPVYATPPALPADTATRADGTAVDVRPVTRICAGGVVCANGGAPDVASTGNTINSATPNAAYTVTPNNGEGVTAFSVTGLTASTATLTIEASDDGGTSWTAINGVAPNTGALFTTLTTDQQFRVNSGGRTRVRLRVSSTGTGTITVASNAASVSSLVGLSAQLPAGANVIGSTTGAQVTPAACSAAVVTSGGSPITLISGPTTQPVTIYNGSTAAQQGIAAAEVFYLNEVSAPGSTDAAVASNSTHSTFPLVAGQSYVVGPLKAGTSVQGNAATTNHAVSCEAKG